MPKFGLESTGETKSGERENIQAIYDYVRNQRAKITKYPALLPLIESFEGWYQGLGWLDLYVDTKQTLGEAQRRRNAINEIMGEKIPDTWTPADKPQTAIQKVKEPLIPTKYKVIAAAGGGAVVGLVVLKKLKVI